MKKVIIFILVIFMIQQCELPDDKKIQKKKEIINSKQKLKHFRDEASGKWGYKDEEGNIIIKAQFNRAMNFVKNRALVVLNNKYGYIDKSGRLVIEAKYDKAWPFVDGMAPVLLSKKWGYIDTKGIVRVDFQFDTVKLDGFKENLAPVFIKDKWGYVDTSGNMVIAPKFDDAYSFIKGKAKVKKGKEIFKIDHSGKKIE